MAAETQTMESFGGHWDAQDQAVAVGGPFDRVTEYMAKRVGVEVNTLAERLNRTIEHLVATRHVPWMPGARHLHEELRAAGVPQALVSNSWRELMQAALADLHTSFDVIIGGDEVERSKPDPLPYLTACARLGVSPEQCIVIEDSATGVAAGLAAGCVVLGVPHVGELNPHPRLYVTTSLEQWTPQRLVGLLTGD